MSFDHQQSSGPGHEPESRIAASDSSGVAGRRPGLGKAAWFVFKAIEIRLRFIAVLVAIGLVIGYWDTIKNHWDKWTRPAAGVGVALSADDEF